MGQNASAKGIFTKGDRKFIEDYYQNLKKLKNERDRLRKESPNSPIIKELTKTIDRITGKFSTFSNKVKERFETLDKDLTFLFKNSKLLNDLKLLDLPSFISVTDYATQLGFPNYETIYEKSKLIPDYSTWKVIEKNSKGLGERKLSILSYWLSKDEPPKHTARNTTIPEYAIIKIHSKYPRKNPITKKTEMIDKRKILKQAVKFEYDYESFIEEEKLPSILPEDENKSLSILKINEKLKNFKNELKEFLKKRNQPELEQITLADVPKEDRHRVSNFQKKPKKKLARKN